MAGGTQRRVFTFWEPRGAITPYLQLCRETWERHLPGWEIVTVDYANLDGFVRPGTLDLAALRQLGLAQQKDAVMVAVLQRHGGLFMDLDTLVTGDLSPVLEGAARADIVMFGHHVAFVAARAGSEAMRLWLTEVQASIGQMAGGVVDPAATRWDYIGNATLTKVYAALREKSLHRRLIRGTAVGRSVWSRVAALKPAPGTRGSMLRRIPSRIEWELSRRHVARHILSLDRSGFIAELAADDGRSTDPVALYRRFWFESDAGLETVFRPGVPAIGLHNSWTPDWYSALGREEVLSHGSRLSAALRKLLVP